MRRSPLLAVMQGGDYALFQFNAFSWLYESNGKRVGLIPSRCKRRSSLPGRLKHQDRPPGARLRADMPHSEPLVRLPYFGFEGPGHARENEPATTPDTSNEDRRHLDQRSGKHVRDDEWPGTLHNIGSAGHKLQPIRQVVQARMLARDFQRIGIDIQANCSRHSHHQ